MALVGDKLKLTNYSYILVPNYTIGDDIPKLLTNNEYSLIHNGSTRRWDEKVIDAFDIDWNPYQLHFDNDHVNDSVIYLSNTDDVISALNKAMSYASHSYSTVYAYVSTYSVAANIAYYVDNIASYGIEVNSDLINVDNIHYSATYNYDTNRWDMRISYSYNYKPGIFVSIPGTISNASLGEYSEIFNDYTSNINTNGNYNHIEGVSNSVINSDIIHAEGSHNTINNSYISHISGSTNIVTNGYISNLSGLNNKINNSYISQISGEQNTVNESYISIVSGYNIIVDYSYCSDILAYNSNIHHSCFDKIFIDNSNINGQTNNNIIGGSNLTIGIDTNSILSYSLVFGNYNSITNSAYTLLFGENNTVNNCSNNVVIGSNNKSNNTTGSIILGTNNQTYIKNSKGHHAVVVGEGLITYNDNETVVGRFNQSDSQSGYLFVVGNGHYNEYRKNAFAVLDNDWTYMPNAYITNLKGAEFEAPNITRLTYRELVTKIQYNELLSGRLYTITDYKTKYSSHLSASAYTDDKTFQITLLAISENTLSNDGWLFDAYNNKKYDIKYTVNNNFRGDKWGDTENGYGVIYYMKDNENNNEAPFEFLSTYNIINDNKYYLFNGNCKNNTITLNNMDSIPNIILSDCSNMYINSHIGQQLHIIKNSSCININNLRGLAGYLTIENSNNIYLNDYYFDITINNGNYISLQECNNININTGSYINIQGFCNRNIDINLSNNIVIQDNCRSISINNLNNLTIQPNNWGIEFNVYHENPNHTGNYTDVVVESGAIKNNNSSKKIININGEEHNTGTTVIRGRFSKEIIID